MNKFVIFFAVLLSAWCSAVAQEIDWGNIKPKNVQVPLTTNNTGGLLVPRIVGGRVATRGQFPYQVALFLDSSSFCGGSLITRSVVLTAAHCTFGSRRITVYLGSHAIRENFESTRIMLSSNNHTAHPRYSDTHKYVDYDIAVVRLPEQVVLTEFIKLIRLPAVEKRVYKNYVDYRARVSGWGIIADGTTTISPVLNYVDVTVISNERCKSTFSFAINPDKLCVATTGGMSPCNGDSGGPLVIQETDRKYTQIGIVSFGSGRGCSKGAPSVFTRVTSYLDNFLASYVLAQ